MLAAAPSSRSSLTSRSASNVEDDPASKYIGAASHCILNKDYAKAHTLLSKAISLNPSKSQLYDLRSVVLTHLEKYDEALKDAQSIYTLDPTSSLGYMRAAKIFRHKDLLEAAYKIYKVARRKVDPADTNYSKIGKYCAELADILGVVDAPPTKPAKQIKITKEDETDTAKKEQRKAATTYIFGPYNIPLEILCSIFQYLSFEELCRSTRLSKSIKHLLMYTPSLWTSLTFGTKGYLITDKTLQSLIARGGQIMHTVKLAGCYKLTKTGIKAIADRKCRISHFELSVNNKVSGSTISGALKFAKSSLRSLILSETLIDDSSLQNVFSSCPNLMEVNLASCKNISAASFVGLAEKVTKDSTFAGPYLQTVNVSKCSSFGDKALVQLVRACPRLKVLDVSYCNDVTSLSLYKLQQCKDLESLILTGTGALTRASNSSSVSLSDAILAIADNCKSLRTFVASRSPFITDTMLQFIGSFCHALENLDLQMCAYISDAALASIALGSSSGKLKSVNFSKCPGITDKGVKPLIQNAKNLEKVHFSNTGISSISLAAFQAHNPVYLQELAVSNCQKISTAAVVELVKGAKNLRVVNIDGCNDVDPGVVRALRTKFPKLLVTHKLQ
ncbi:Dynein regulatory complex subunit 6 [Chytridiales sp. JEL 0842]|nr:Dynein regulatory complex subunit 6 [Chytridiales sp. JEL 0842]